MNNISVSELQHEDLPALAAYWFDSPKLYLEGMGVDVRKLPDRAGFLAQIGQQLALLPAERRSFALAWRLNGTAIGHCNLNPFVFGETGHMHLHLWQAEHRRMGLGLPLLKLSLPVFFNLLQLQQIICEPYAFNPAPNALLAKAGFSLVKTYRTTPGSINFEQEVRQWLLLRSNFEANRPKI
ncbi:MAG: GNAT family protein [Sphingobacteriaceae bacterium]|nr:GNAT family protein [Sphingobacteriaceae bacterium]